jgi:hypothetical protein
LPYALKLFNLANISSNSTEIQTPKKLPTVCEVLNAIHPNEGKYGGQIQGKNP